MDEVQGVYGSNPSLGKASCTHRLRADGKLTFLVTRLLLDYVYNIGDRSSRLLHHTTADVPKSVASIERWATDWQITVTIVGRLRSEEFMVTYQADLKFWINLTHCNGYSYRILLRTVWKPACWNL